MAKRQLATLLCLHASLACAAIPALTLMQHLGEVTFKPAESALMPWGPLPWIVASLCFLAAALRWWVLYRRS